MIMNLYIQINESGEPLNHPAFEDNLVQVFGNIPTNWEPFFRVQRPVPNAYQVLDSQKPTYQKVDGVWTDVWAIRDMTDEEKTAKQKSVKDKWASKPQAENWSTWTFDEATCAYVPPIPRPDAVKGKDIRWCGADNNWKEVPPRPTDGKPYDFDFLNWNWVEVTSVQQPA